MKNTKTMQVAMLPTEKARIQKAKDGSLHLINSDSCSPYFIPQHLYIVSDAEIKEGDWKYCSKTNYITQFVSKAKGSIADKCKGCKKIEATTEINLGGFFRGVQQTQLPQIPQSFIEAYVKAEGKITDCLVEVCWVHNCTKKSCTCEPMTTTCGHVKSKFEVKTRPDNTIIIHEAKKYSRDEMIKAWELGREYEVESNKGFGEAKHLSKDKWIEENL